MATAHPIAPALSAEAAIPPNGLAAGNGVEQALVALPHAPIERSSDALAAAVAKLPVELEVSIPVRKFRVRNLLALEPSHLIESGWGHGEDVPLAAGTVQLAWSEFEVVEAQLAVRLTRLV